MAEAYVPGVCNINRAEIAYRRKAGYFGLGLALIVAAALLALDANRWFRIVIFVPAFIAAIGFLQAKNKFCVSYAASGRQNATEGSKAAQKVDDAARTVDKSRARKMNLQAAAWAAIATAILVAV